MDLGVAKLQEATIAITKEGQFAGSLLYAAPEQFKKEPVGPPADLYSLGVLLYELATGQNPFRSDDASAVIQAHLTETPPPAHERNEDLSLFFSELVATLLAKQPADRFASAEELHDGPRRGRTLGVVDRARAGAAEAGSAAAEDPRQSARPGSTGATTTAGRFNDALGAAPATARATRSFSKARPASARRGSSTRSCADSATTTCTSSTARIRRRAAWAA